MFYKYARAGVIRRCICPACGRRGDFPVVKRYMASAKLLMRNMHYNISYLTTCPFCASLIKLNKVVAATSTMRKSGYTVSPEELVLLENHYIWQCPSCGTRNSKYAGRCFQCGCPQP